MRGPCSTHDDLKEVHCTICGRRGESGFFHHGGVCCGPLRIRHDVPKQQVRVVLEFFLQWDQGVPAKDLSYVHPCRLQFDHYKRRVDLVLYSKTLIVTCNELHCNGSSVKTNGHPWTKTTILGLRNPKSW